MVEASRGMPALAVAMAAMVLAGVAAPPERVSFPTQDGGLVSADMYGEGGCGVVLAHGGRFNKESWEKQARRLRRCYKIEIPQEVV